MIREREKERCLASVVRAQRQWPADIAANILRSCTFPRMPYIYIGSAWLVPMWMRRIPPDPPCKPVNDMALPDSRSHNLDANCQGSNSLHFVRQVRCLLFPNNANTSHLFITLGARSGRRELSGPKRQLLQADPNLGSHMGLAFPRVSESARRLNKCRSVNVQASAESSQEPIRQDIRRTPRTTVGLGDKTFGFRQFGRIRTTPRTAPRVLEAERSSLNVGSMMSRLPTRLTGF